MGWALTGNIKGVRLSSRLTAAVTSSLVTYGPTGLTLTLVAGKAYQITAYGQYRSAALTTGIGLRLAGTVVPAGVRTTTNIWNASTPTLLQAAALSTALLTPAVAAAATDYTWEVSGVIRVTTGGTLTVEFASEVAGSVVTIQPDCFLVAEELL